MSSGAPQSGSRNRVWSSYLSELCAHTPVVCNLYTQGREHSIRDEGKRRGVDNNPGAVLGHIEGKRGKRAVEMRALPVVLLCHLVVAVVPSG